MIEAHVTYENDIDSSCMIDVSTGHRFQFGGANGDSYCHSHQSFDCIEGLSLEEKTAINHAQSGPRFILENDWVRLIATKLWKGFVVEASPPNDPKINRPDPELWRYLVRWTSGPKVRETYCNELMIERDPDKP